VAVALPGLKLEGTPHCGPGARNSAAVLWEVLAKLRAGANG
jgi:hypothetical protein